MRRIRGLIGAGWRLGGHLLASAAAILLLAGEFPVGAVVWGVGYAWMLLGRVRRRFSGIRSLRSLSWGLLVIGTAGLLTDDRDHKEPYWWVILLVCVLAVPLLQTRWNTTKRDKSRFTGLGTDGIEERFTQWARATEWTLLAMPALLFIVFAVPASPLLGGALVLLIIATALSALAERVMRARVDAQLQRELAGRLEGYRPKFLVHWDAPGESVYQLEMWLPHLEELGALFAVITRTRSGFEAASRVSRDAPVILAETHSDVERLLVPSATAILYVNNADRNNQVLRFERFTHIMLSHGDSDKTTSSTRIFQLFDRVYMAGQAGIDRFADSGVDIAPSKFAIVGRPQVKGIVRDERPIAGKPRPTVLYAPTWQGDFRDSSYTSLPYAEGLVRELLDRGCTVVFRPHPFTDRVRETEMAAARIREMLREHAEKTGVPHRFGEVAERDMSLHACFNASDAMIADVSAVVSDYLYSGKPIGIFARDDESLLDAESEGKYRFSRDSAEWPTQLDRLLGEDPLRERRLDSRRYYLGNAEVTPPDLLFVNTLLRDLRAR